VSVRLRRLPLWPMMAGGIVTGFVGGFVIGCMLGALLAWFSGSVLDWHRQLGFTLGVTQALLPLGDQIGLLQTISDLWWLVVPATGLALGLLSALVGMLAGGLAAGVFNRLSGGVWLDVEVPRREETASPALAGEASPPAPEGASAQGQRQLGVVRFGDPPARDRASSPETGGGAG
jgi:hypothetical protein